ncbi:cyclic nucleotide-binding domain-containing protein [Fulvimarina sp. 2208YS6-2-32]|uniref:Cyclic nucleotide-binding domain-containing protein n=1 Tax=Fulvimarina uroteuthidis TaxID=3098149 RepID=A0ABU5I0H2_9HYPH|nr:cyclic nucleotide-binding domain-containing protein [Fulvimarina sp. 2208YS6-2-32]MDY8108565.1 cyclic nucleotide-binding domain-containing protein [Fulvimarina sp. 2208YS6-2-32]
MSLQSDIAVLRSVKLFDSLDEDALRLLAFGAEHRRFPAGDTVFREAALADAGFVVVSGTVVLTQGDANPPKIVGAYGPGTLIGEMALITETRRPATARAETPADLLRVGRTHFRRLLEEYPAFAATLEARLRDRFVQMTRQISAMESRFRDP